MNTGIIDAIRRQGIELKTEGDKLLFRPRGQVSDALRTTLQKHKPEIVALLSQPSPSYSALADLYHRYWVLPETPPGDLPIAPPRDRPSGAVCWHGGSLADVGRSGRGPGIGRTACAPSISIPVRCIWEPRGHMPLGNSIKKGRVNDDNRCAGESHWNLLTCCLPYTRR